MYKIPDDIDFDILINSKLIQISFTLNTISFHFDHVGYISLEGAFKLIYEDKDYVYNSVYPVKADLGLLKLLEKRVISWQVNEQRQNLKLVFEDDSSLEFISDSNYESYRINFNDKEILI